MNKTVSNKLNMDEVCKLLGVDTISDVEEYAYSTGDGSTYSYAYSEAKKEGKSDEEAEEFAMKAESDDLKEHTNKYYDAVIYAADRLLDWHALKLVPVKVRRKGVDRPWEYRVEPEAGRTWNDALTMIRQTVNGVGMFEFASNKEMYQSIPCTARQCVLHHLHWMKEYPSVYGDRSIQSIIDDRMRY